MLLLVGNQGTHFPSSCINTALYQSKPQYYHIVHITTMCTTLKPYNQFCPFLSISEPTANGFARTISLWGGLRLRAWRQRRRGAGARTWISGARACSCCGTRASSRAESSRGSRSRSSFCDPLALWIQNGFPILTLWILVTNLLVTVLDPFGSFWPMFSQGSSFFFVFFSPSEWVNVWEHLKHLCA